MFFIMKGGKANILLIVTLMTETTILTCDHLYSGLDGFC